MNSARRAVRWLARVGLGLFIVWQLVFLVGANTVSLVLRSHGFLAEQPLVQRLAPDWSQKEGQAYDTLQTADQIARHWSDLTAQPENWALFAPTVLTDITFPAVELRWQHPAVSAPVLLLSENEPPDKECFFRVGRFRLRRYEGCVDLLLDPSADGDEAAEKQRWRNYIAYKVRKDGAMMRVYADQRWRGWQAAHPDMPPPDWLVLLVRRYRVPPPGTTPWTWDGPHMVPVARWTPNAYSPPEMYNPVTEQFEKLPEE
jgi:hypothetical protein